MSFKEEKRLADSSFELKTRAIYKKDSKNTNDQRKFNTKRSICTATSHRCCCSDIEEDCQIRAKTLASVNGTPAGIMFTILPEDPRLIKKSARGAPKLLS
jgi:hypothetical protein